MVGIVSGGVGCGGDPDKKPNFPKWWARVSLSRYLQNLSMETIAICTCVESLGSGYKSTASKILIDILDRKPRKDF